MKSKYVSLTITEKMYLNIAVIITGMVILVTLLFLQSAWLDQLSKKTQLSEKLNSGMLTLRRNEKDFLARINGKYLDEFNVNYLKLQDVVQTYHRLEDDPQLKKFTQLLNDYREVFIQLVELQKIIGFHPKDGSYGALREAVHRIEARIQAANEYKLLAQTLQLRRREKDFMLRLDIKYVEAFNKDIITLKQNVADSSLADNEKQAILADADNYQVKFIQLFEAQKQMGLDHDTGLQGKMRGIIHQTESILAQLVVSNEEKIKNSHASVKFWGGLMSMITVILVCGFIYLSTRSILAPIKEMSARIRQIRKTNDLTIRVNEQGRDEVSVMGYNFNSLMNDFSALVKNVNTALVTLDGAAHGLSSSAADTQQETKLQLTETDMVATAVTQMSATIDGIAKNTERAAQMSNATNDKAKDGYHAVTQTAENINGLSHQLGSAAEVVQALAQDAQNIGQVLDVIRNIADQTNLLALNAAIEAARAGDQGRGFAVVADEVRSLAMRTQESTREIEQIIATLQSRTNNVVEVMANCRSRGDDSASQAEKTGELLLQITEDVLVISDMSTQIAAAIEQQSAVANEVGKNIVKIRDIAEHTDTNAQDIFTVSTDVSDQASVLVSAVNRFKA